MTGKVSQKKTKYIIVSILVAAVIIVVSGGAAFMTYGQNHGWWGEPDTMTMVKKEAVADEKLLGLILAKSEQTEPVGFMGKYPGSRIVNCFELNGEPVKIVETKITQFAVNDGWAQDVSATTLNSWVGYKNADLGGRMALIVSSNEKNSFCGPDEVQLSVSY